MEILSFNIQYSNPSMGPHEKVTTFELHNQPIHAAAFERLLKEAKIFDYSIEQYIRAIQTNDLKILNDVRKKAEETDTSNFSTGGTLSQISLQISKDKILQLSDTRFFKLTGYYLDFISYAEEKGFKNQFSKNGPQITPTSENVVIFNPLKL